MKKSSKIIILIAILFIVVGTVLCSITKTTHTPEDTQPKAIGTLEIPNILNYTVGKSSDNEYYLNRDIQGSESIQGSIFMDYRNNENVLDNKNTILYGHKMKDGSMFSVLHEYLDDKDFFEDNRYVYFTDSNNIKHTYEVFSVYSTDESDTDYLEVEFKSLFSKGLYLFNDFITELTSRSVYETDTIVNNNSKILTLSTCDKRQSSTGRVALHAKKVDSNNVSSDTTVTYNETHNDYISMSPKYKVAGYTTFAGDSYFSEAIKSVAFSFDKVLYQLSDTFSTSSLSTEDNFFNYNPEGEKDSNGKTNYDYKMENKFNYDLEVESRHKTYYYGPERIVNPKTGVE